MRPHLHGEQVPQRAMHQIDRNLGPGPTGAVDDPLQRPLELSYARADSLGDLEGHLVRHLDALGFPFLLQDGDPGLQLRRYDLDREPADESRLQPFLEPLDFARIPVAGQDDLVIVGKYRVENVEEFLLGLELVGEELDVVDQQGVDRSEALHDRIDRARADSTHHFVGESLRRDVDHLRATVAAQELVAYRLHQVCLAEPNPTVEQQRDCRICPGSPQLAMPRPWQSRSTCPPTKASNTNPGLSPWG